MSYSIKTSGSANPLFLFMGPRHHLAQDPKHTPGVAALLLHSQQISGFSPYNAVSIIYILICVQVLIPGLLYDPLNLSPYL